MVNATVKIVRTLRVHLEGQDVAIAEHRMSLDQLAAYAKLLLSAYRRTAQEILTGNRDGTGRPPNVARNLQLELVTFEPGCVNLAIAPRDLNVEETVMLGEPLEALALANLAAGIDLARRPDERVNPAVRKLLRFFPPGIRQRYSLTRDGVEERSVEITSDEIAAPRAERMRARVEHMVGTVRGIMVEPAAVFFHVDGTTHRLVATTPMVDRAWSQRNEPVLVATAVVTATENRIIALRSQAAFDRWQHAEPSTTVADVVSKWSGALELLAEYDRNR